MEPEVSLVFIIMGRWITGQETGWSPDAVAKILSPSGNKSDFSLKKNKNKGEIYDFSHTPVMWRASIFLEQTKL